MDFLYYMFEHAWNFTIASIPLVLVFLQLIIFKLPFKAIVICLLLNALMSIFFWVKLKDIELILYQIVPYVLTIIWLFSYYIVTIKNKGKNS